MLLKVLSRSSTLLIGLLAAAALTGRTKRRYFVYAPEDSVQLAGQSLSIRRIAEEYQPRMYVRASTPSPKLLWVWYEAVPTTSGIELIYYHAWENEVHPHTLIHSLYSIFRAAYYGYPLYDIEYFQMSIDRDAGAISALRFETSRREDFYQWAPRHVTARWTLNDDGTYRVVQSSGREADVERIQSANLMRDGNRIRIGAQTWNHLTRVLDETDAEYGRAIDAPLRFLSDGQYRRHKFARRSRGDYGLP